MTPVSDRSWGLAEGGTNKTSATNGANHDRSRLDRLRCELDHRQCEPASCIKSWDRLDRGSTSPRAEPASSRLCPIMVWIIPRHLPACARP